MPSRMLALARFSNHVLRITPTFNVVINQLIDLLVAEHRRVVGDADTRVKDWVSVCDAGFDGGFVVGAREPAGVRELQADEQVVARVFAEACVVRID